MRPPAPAWCAALLALATSAAAYTVDCNHEYTDCDELNKQQPADDYESSTSQPESTTVSTKLPERTTSKTIPTIPTIPPIPTTTYAPQLDQFPDIEEEKTPNDPHKLTIDELQSFASLLHNQMTSFHKGKALDLSDINLDNDEEEKVDNDDKRLQEIPKMDAPFINMMMADKSDELDGSCKEMENVYKIGDKIDRGCDETCECVPGGTFDCSPRCKHPYVRRGRNLGDPLCFESSVDDCCSIIACATGNTDGSHTSRVPMDGCRYGNETYAVGQKWNITCEQICTCEANDVVNCKPRCSPLLTSDKCINVQDPHDSCCELQVCDVSQDVHEEPENATSTTSTTEKYFQQLALSPVTDDKDDYDDEKEEQLEPIGNNTAQEKYPEKDKEADRRTEQTHRPLVLSEPIGSVTVLQNQTVQVNLIHPNNTNDPIHLLLSSDGGETYKDIELKYSNLILNLERAKNYVLKTKETGTKFNFTVTASDNCVGTNEQLQQPKENDSMYGCLHEGTMYAIGEEYQIGCTELCECTGNNRSECAVMACPNHVGLELVSRGCVQWDAGPTPHPPNCCPRTARCLSDGSCKLSGHTIPNWSEVPIALTGCEQRCFCENGDLDCQDVCSPLPPLPPQTLRCPPMFQPAPVNVSDEDCCKKWGCVSNANSSIEAPRIDRTEENEERLRIPLMPHTHTHTHEFNTSTSTTERVKTMKNHSHSTSAVKPLLKQLSEKLKNKLYFSKDFKFKSKQHESRLEPKDYTSVTSRTQYSQSISNDTYPKIQDTPLVEHEHMNEEIARLDKVYHHDAKDSTGSSVDLESVASDIIRPELPERKPPKQDTIDLIQPSSPNTVKIMMKPEPPPVSYALQPQPLDPVLTYRNTMGPNVIIPDIPLRKTYRPDVMYPEGPTAMSSDYMQSNTMHTIAPQEKYMNVVTPNRNPPTQIPSSRNFNRIQYFQPSQEDRKMESTAYKPLPSTTTESLDYFELLNRRNLSLKSFKQSKLYHAAKKFYGGRHFTNLREQSMALKKQNNPYLNILRVPEYKVAVRRSFHDPQEISKAVYKQVDLNQLMDQMGSKVSRQLGRSIEDTHEYIQETTLEVPGTPPILTTTRPHVPQLPVFLPTLPPDEHYPQEDLADYDQNNIHRPVIPDHVPNPQLSPNIPPHTLPPPPKYADDNKKLTVISLESDSPTSIKMLFGLPPVLVGLRGSVDLRYTDKPDEDVSRWYSQVFAPTDEILSTSRLEFQLNGLKPSTAYRVRGKLYLHNLPVEPESDIYSVTTRDAPRIEEKRRPVDCKLTVVEANDTVAHVIWRHFSEDELLLIDGIQVRYRPVGTPIYLMTELLHHSRSTADLVDLRPDSRYEASLVLVPPPRALTELFDPTSVEFITQPYIDPYNWSVTIEAASVGSNSASLTWRGVPSPPERWVRVYRGAHACGGGRAREHDAFQLAVRDTRTELLLTGMEPDTRCRVWLELFLTNGKVKTSNVLEIMTKPADSDSPVDNEIEQASSLGARGGPTTTRGDYYGSLVVVGVVAALGAVTSLLLLLIVVRRHRPRSVPITSVPSAPRDSSLPPYDNPAYKLELQQETMDL